jgi:hypothetical protein
VVDVRTVREDHVPTQLKSSTRFGPDSDPVRNGSRQGRTRPDSNTRGLLPAIATAPDVMAGALRCAKSGTPSPDALCSWSSTKSGMAGFNRTAVMRA